MTLPSVYGFLFLLACQGTIHNFTLLISTTTILPRLPMGGWIRCREEKRREEKRREEKRRREENGRFQNIMLHSPKPLAPVNYLLISRLLTDKIK